MKSPASVALSLLPCLALAACADPRPRQARDRALDYFRTHVERRDPRWAGLLPYLERRFGLTVELAGGDPAGAALSEIYRRLEDPRARLSRARIAALPTAVERIGVSALYCDQIGLPDDWVDVLRRATRKGGYATTHAVLAAEWTLENRCLPEARLAGLHAEQIDTLGRLLEDRDALAADFAAAADIWLEALVMLHYAGAGDRVRPEWVDVLLALQNPDGGFPLHPRSRASDPHPTALALWALSELAQPEAPRISWIPWPP